MWPQRLYLNLKGRTTAFPIRKGTSLVAGSLAAHTSTSKESMLGSGAEKIYMFSKTGLFWRPKDPSGSTFGFFLCV